MMAACKFRGPSGQLPGRREGKGEHGSTCRPRVDENESMMVTGNEPTWTFNYDKATESSL